MLLNALLIIFTVVLIVIAVGMVIWWKKFGKSFFEMSKNLSKMNQNMLKNQKIGNLGDFTKDFDEQMKIIQQFMKKK
jgi:uncharacterized protein YoxC